MIDDGGGVDGECNLKFNINCNIYQNCLDSGQGGGGLNH